MLTSFRVGAKGRLVLRGLREAERCEFGPLTGFLGFHRPRPLTRFRMPAERGVKRPVWILEDEADVVALAGSIAQGFRKSAAVDVVSVWHVAFAGVVVGNQDHCLIRDRAVGGGILI